MKIRNLTYLIVALLATGLLWGCGSSGGGGSDISGDGEFMVETLGLNNCVQCHTNVTDDWLDGRHANVAGPDDPRPSLHLEGSSCQPCHNNTYDADNMPSAVGVSLRDVVACESCHGGGGAHRGIGPLPYPKPGVAQCAQCHAEVDEVTGEVIALRSRSGHSPGALNVVTDYMGSGHADAPRDRSTRSDAIGCNRCHSDEGAKLYAHLNTIDEITDAAGRGRGATPLGLENISSIGCATCHDPHDVGGTKLLLSASADASAQYNTCNHCHAGDNLDLNYHEGHMDADGLLDRQINDTHYDDVATGYSTGKTIEGYVIRKGADTACADCHNVHSGDNTINDQWARSAHGGFILDAKQAAAAAAQDVLAAGSNDNAGEAGYAPGWAHYDWDDSNGTGPSGSNRQGCQECHTATGIANYLDDPDNYDPVNNDFGHLAGWTANGWSDQNELLYCWGCHSDAGTGELRNPGAITRPYTVSSSAVILPDVGSSNVCINCHGARGNMEGYALDENPSTDFTGLNAGFGAGTKNVTEAHYLVAAATIYAADSRIGYEYSEPGGALLDYAPVPYFAHDAVGLNADSPETGAGPCVACHMETAEGHLFAVVTKDETTGAITALNATSCVTCHDGDHGNPGLVVEDTTTAFGLQTAAAAAAFLEEEAEGYHDALAALLAAIEARGVTWTGGYPYFSTATAGSWINEGVFGAAHNYNYLHHEPGAYAHNRIYTKRLIYDSLDWLDDYDLNESVSINAATYPAAAVWLSARP